ncbi:MAG: transposase [Burkholderiales bacterium]|nr:transposase [Burkholderiales bacterium]
MADSGGGSVIPAAQRKELERLSRTITRTAIANERLRRNRNGKMVPQLKSA